MAGVLSRLFGRRVPEMRAAAEERSAGFYGAPAFGFAGAGASVSPVAAENLSTVCACVNAISSGLASLPARVYRRQGDGDRVELPGHPVARLVRAPNPRQTWPDLIEWLMAQTLLWGNGLLQIEADGAGRPVALVPIPWQHVRPVILPGGRLAYDVVAYQAPWGGTGQPRRLLSGEVLHLKDRSDDGFVGRSRLSRAGEVLTAATGLQEYSSAIWRNGANLSGVLTMPKNISPEGIRRMRAAVDEAYTGAHNARRIMYLDPDSTWTPISVSPEDAEVLASRRFSGEELARLFNCPPSIIGNLERSTFTNSETAGRWFAQFTLAPWARKLEAEFSRSVFSDPACELDVDLSGLMRGAEAERWAAHKIAVETGVLDPGEVRQLEGWNARKNKPAPDSVPAWAAATDPAPAPANVPVG